MDKGKRLEGYKVLIVIAKGYNEYEFWFSYNRFGKKVRRF